MASPQIHERHRHRYEFNRDYEEVITSHGMRVTGETPDAMYVEICELPDHPWYLGCQFHPEFKSKPLESHPLFSSFVGAAFRHRGTRVRNEQAPRSRAIPARPRIMSRSTRAGPL